MFDAKKKNNFAHCSGGASGAGVFNNRGGLGGILNGRFTPPLPDSVASIIRGFGYNPESLPGVMVVTSSAPLKELREKLLLNK